MESRSRVPCGSSAYHAQSNGRAEAAVKTVKRALRDNTGQDGRLDTDTFARALLLLRNTPDKDTGTSPAELLFGHRLRDALPQPYARRQALISNNSPVDKRWLEMWSERETAMRVRMGDMVDRIDAKAHDLAPLEVGDKVRVQNQTGPHKTRWSRTGTVMEVNLDYDQYHVKMDGSRRTTARNRKFLRKIRAVAPSSGRVAGDTVTTGLRPGMTPVEPPAWTSPDRESRNGTSPVTGSPAPGRTIREARVEPATPVRPAGQTPRRQTGIPLRQTGIPLRDAVRRVTFGDTPRNWTPPMGADRTEDVEDGREDGDLHHVPVQPATPVTQRQSVRPAAPAEQVQPPRDGGRPTRNRRPPSRFEDYEMAEMSDNVRRTSSTDEEEDDVGGMLEDDILGPNQSNGDAAVRSISGPGRALARRKDHATQLGNVILGMKELLAMNGVNEIKAAQIIGRMALDF